MEITAEMHKRIKENKDRLFVAYQNCKIYDVINVKPCYKCSRLGHNGQRCRNNPTCLKCVGTRLTKKSTTAASQIIDLATIMILIMSLLTDKNVKF